MRLLLINAVCGLGSTGRICQEIASRYVAQGHEVRIAFGRNGKMSDGCSEFAVRIGSGCAVRVHGILTRLFDWHGDRFCSCLSTLKFLAWCEAWRPDVVWLHNIHGYYINYELLFQWIKRHPEMEVKWTLHDCWAFTGHCSHFLLTGCEKWKSGCCNCPEKQEYPKSLLLDSCKSNWWRKRRAFCGVKNMTLISPSQWLAGLTRVSFLKEYPVEIVRNDIDRSVFKPVCGDVKKRLGITGKKMILGVASTWDARKGLDAFLRLRSLLGDEYAIVLVGLTNRQVSHLKCGITGIPRTGSQKELAEFYSGADWFFNPTREDNYPTVNLEARACGCRIVTYDTGGSAETVEGYDKAWVLHGDDKSPEGFVRLLKRQTTVSSGLQAMSVQR